MSQVNDELFKANGLFAQGRDLLHMGSCSSVRAVVDQIVSLMTVPLVQGTLRYAWKVGQTGGVDNRPSDQFAKNAASGSTYAAAVLPLVHACDPAAASVVSDNLKFGAAVYAPSQFTVFAVQLSWDAAQQDCQARGGELATIHGAEDNEELLLLLRAQQDAGTWPTNNGWGGAWIGLTDTAQENTFIWAGSPAAATYFNWGDNEPNNSGEEDCVTMWAAGTWNDDDCSAVHPYVCSLSSALAPPPPPHVTWYAPVVSGTKPDTGAVKAALETTYACLGITCGQVGGLLNGARTAA